jgi:hypothetical protein
MMKRKFPGGRTEPIDPKLREKALRIAARRGVEQASRATGVKQGTIRSWEARARAKVERAQEGEGVLEALKREGRKMLAAREAAEAQAERETSPPCSLESPGGSDEPMLVPPKPKRRR